MGEVHGDTDRFNLFLTAEAALLQYENYYEEIFADRYFEDPPCQDHVEDSLVMLAPRTVSSHELARKLPTLRRHAEMLRSLCPVPDETGETIFPAVPDFLLAS